MAAMTLQQVGQALLGPAMTEQQTLQQMTSTMQGNAAAAQDLYNQLQKIANMDAFPTASIEQAGQFMLSLGIATQNVIPEMQTLANVVAATGGDATKIDAIAQELQKIQDAGKVTVMDMTRLTDQGVQAWQALADGLGTSVPEAMKKVQSGTLSANDAINALMKGFKDLYANAGADKANTLAGAWQSFTNELGQIVQVLFGPLVQGLTMVLSLFNAGAQALGNFGDALNKAIGSPTFAQQQQQINSFFQAITGGTSTASQGLNSYDAALNQTQQTANSSNSAIASTATATATAATATKSATVAAQEYAADLSNAADAAQKASSAISSVIPGSFQDEINNASKDMSTLTIHITELS
ncbi:MAG: hypothetical protein B7W98_02520, partial [Parcubacteria group bacterium 20-58-5]